MKNRRIVLYVVAALAAALFLGWGISVVAAAFRGERYLDPVLLRLGPLQVRWYGALIAGSFIPAYWLVALEAERKGYDVQRLTDFITAAALGGLLGARLVFVAQNLPYFLAHPGRILAAWEGGLSIHGVMAGGVLVALWFTRRTNTPFLPFVDMAIPGLLLGQAIGRWGNFFNQELFGYPTDVPWKMYVRPENRPEAWADFEFFHPTFLYESMWNFLALGFLLWYRRRPWAREGDVFFLYFTVYSLGRFWVEFFRIEPAVAGGLTLAQWVSLGLAALGIILTVSSRHRRPLKVTYYFPPAVPRP